MKTTLTALLLFLATAWTSLAQTTELFNPSFELDPAGETTTVIGWHTFGPNVYSETDSTAAHSGTDYLKVFQDFSGQANYSGVYQDLPCSPGATFAADGWAYTSSSDKLAGGNVAWLEVTFRDAATNILALYRSASITSAFPANTWIRLPVTNQYDPNTYAFLNTTSTLVAPAGTASVRYQVVLQGDAAGSGGSVYFDDLNLANPAASGGWNLVWSDEFNGTNVDLGKWTYDTGDGCPSNCGFGNGEKEYYTSRTNNAYVSGGVLHIVAQKESYDGASYTSARLKTQGLFSQKYGLIEFRAKLPQGSGCWPALWMLGTNITSVGWPTCGEIDVMENAGTSSTQVGGTLHWAGPSTNDVYDTQKYQVPDSVTNFHTYAVEWSTNSIKWLVDGNLVYTWTDWSYSTGLYPAPFNKDFFLIMNLAIGGNYLGFPSDATINSGTAFPVEMQVDYVRVFAWTNSPPVVTTLADAGPGSLRDTIASATNGATITFAHSLDGQTLTLTTGELYLDKDLTIDASSLPDGFTISGNSNGDTNAAPGESRHFEITAGHALTLRGLTLINGIAYQGGSILNAGNLTVDACTFHGNIGTGDGGAIQGYGGSTNTIIASTFYGNQSLTSGGAIAHAGTVTVENSTFFDNTASAYGGGIFNYQGSLTVENSTIVSNQAGTGGGISLLGYGPAPTLALTNSIVALNTASVGSNLLQAGPDPGTIAGSHNLINGVPMLAPLGKYGGPTQTLPPLPGSPAIDAGLDTGSLPATDQRGLPRVVGSAVDIGAVESGNPIPGYDYSIVTTTNDFLSSLTNSGVSLRSAVAFTTNGATITFASNLSGQTIVLTNGELQVDKNLNIDASTLADGITINGNHASRIFYFSGGNSTLDSLTLINGYSSGDSGGGIYNLSGGVTINNSTLSGNSAYYGGGIANFSTLTLNNSTLSGNDAGGGGGGIYNFACILTLNNSTLSGNAAALQGGGIYDDGYNGLLFFTNSIIAGNTATIEPDIDGIIGSGRNNLTSGNPLLAPLGNYGGPTQTMPPLPGSPAIDAGSDSVTNFLATDQRGLARLVGAHVDIGAVEGVYVAHYTGPGLLKDSMRRGDGSFQFGFTNNPDMNISFSVWATTNIALPFNRWTDLGAPLETPAGSGQFQFADPGATNYSQRYYRVESP